ncbi:MAG: zinc ribbon domain-containing protein [Lentisphaerae bacterium]|nr:zinc ribbon domain-containing protein [Lentisphaerota bacterium]
MPVFEYKCQKCEKSFDYLARTLSDKPDACPECGSKKLVKQLSSFSASVKSGSSASCSMGSCSTPTCSTGTCPFG